MLFLMDVSFCLILFLNQDKKFSSTLNVGCKGLKDSRGALITLLRSILQADAKIYTSTQNSKACSGFSSVNTSLCFLNFFFSV